MARGRHIVGDTTPECSVVPVVKTTDRMKELQEVLQGIETRIKTMRPCNQAGRTLWSEEEVALRNSYILTLTRMGLSRWQIATKVSHDFSISKSQATRWLEVAYNELVEQNKVNIEAARAVHIERLEELYRIAMESSNYGSALKVLDQLAKTNGLYDANNVVRVPNFTFNFGEVKSNIIPCKEGDIIINGIEDED